MPKEKLKRNKVIKDIKDKMNQTVKSYPGPIFTGLGNCESSGSADVYVPTIEEKIYRLEYQGKSEIESGNIKLAQAARIRKTLKDNPSLSDLYTLMRF